jgi:Flp pilus assembly protein TadG
MSASHRQRRLRIFAKDDRASVAIEFAAVSVPLMMMIYGILELGLMFFVSAALDQAADDLARKIRTGQAYSASMTHSAAITALCDGVLSLFSCSSNLHLYISVVTDLSSITKVSAVDSSGNLNSTVVHNIGGASDYVLLQAYLPWNSFFTMLGSSTVKLSDGSYLLGSTFFFRNEPFAT